jgi:anti-sigma factor RsiW
MGSHEEFLELCAAATAGELSAAEQAKLDRHLAGCPECRRAMREYEATARRSVAALALELAPNNEEDADVSWPLEKAEKAFFKRLDKEQADHQPHGAREDQGDQAKQGQRFTYRPSQFRWREVWMTFAAAVLLALALGIASYRTGVKRGSDVARMLPTPPKAFSASLEEQVSDAGYERAQLVAKVAEQDKVVADLRRQVSEQLKQIKELKESGDTTAQATITARQSKQIGTEAGAKRNEELSAAQTKLQELQRTIETLTGQRGEMAGRASVLEAKVDELTQLVRDREQALDQRQAEVAKQQELLEHDRDIRELMGARDLYIAEVHDVSRNGQTDKTYGRVFYTKGKSLIFYAYDLDAQRGIRNASTFQAWGRRGPDKQQALNLGIFYEDNVSKKRWVLKADDPKTLEDIDAVFVTVEPTGGSHHPSGKQLLFAYLRVNPNHP